MKSSKGFSLLEAMMVIAVIGILSAIAVPSIINQRNNAKLRDAVSMIRGNFEMARSRAIRENAFVPVLINADGYTIFIDDGPGAAAGNWAPDGGEKILCDTKLPAGIRIDLAQTTFTDSRTRFNGRGYSANAGILTVLGPGMTVTVDMNNRFGRITTTYN
jgi:prepilin-type N-terminal cleavage/methylation domain-containing protein